MKLTSADLYQLCNTAIDAARQAGNLIGEYADKNISVQNKEGGNSLASQVVTEVDFKAQEVILNVLEKSISDYDLALLTEERVDDKSRFEKDYFWCIDPMDGTLPFTEKTPGYAVSIALVSKKGEAIIGVVFDPVTQTLYHAIKGQGAFKNKNPWQPDLLSRSNNSFNLNIDRSFVNHRNYAKLLSEFEKLLPELGLTELKIQKHAGAVLNACWVLDHAPGCYFKLPKPEVGGGALWDFAATTCIIKETGAFVSDCYGEPLDLNKSGSTFMNLKGVLFASNKEIATMIFNMTTFQNL